MSDTKGSFWGFDAATYNRTRYAFYLFINGAGHKEVAAALNISVSLVTKEIAKARREILTDYENGMTAREVESKYQIPIEILADEGRDFGEKQASKCFDNQRYTEGEQWRYVCRGLYGVCVPKETRNQRGKSRKAGWTASLVSSKIPKLERSLDTTEMWLHH